MEKLIRVLLATAVIFLITGCQENTSATGSNSYTQQTSISDTGIFDTLPSSPESASTTSGITSEPPEAVSKPSCEYFIGLCGEKLYYRDAAELLSFDEPITAQEAETAEHVCCIFTDWAYIIYPKTVEASTLPRDIKGEYSIARIGDKFGTLTVAETNVSTITPNLEIYQNVFYMPVYLKFNGEITLTGTCWRETSVEPAEFLYFRLDEEQWKDMPLLVDQSTLRNNTSFDVGIFRYDYSDTSLDLSILPEDGTERRVKVTLTDVEIGMDWNAAEIISIEAI